jgi:hypothetical protein
MNIGCKIIKHFTLCINLYASAEANPATRANQLAKALIRERPNIVLIKFNPKLQ